MKAVVAATVILLVVHLTYGQCRSVAFNRLHLDHPRQHHTDITGRFVYLETGTYNLEPDTARIILNNGYARAQIINPADLVIDHERYRVKKIQVVFTKYPYDQNKWLTNYYDLLSWRLTELFRLDSLLNDDAIDFEMVLQTECTTASLAKSFFHGIVLELEPLAITTDQPEAIEPISVQPRPIENGGFLFREERNPDMSRNPYPVTSDPDKPLRRQMDPKKLKCPSWR